MVRDIAYLAVQSVAIAVLGVTVVASFGQGASGTTFVIALSAFVVTVSAVLLGLPASVRDRVTLPRSLNIVFASRTRTVITVIATGLLIVAGASHAHPGFSPATTDSIDTAGASFELTPTNGTVTVRYTAGPSLERSALSVRIDGQLVSDDPTLAVRAPGLSDSLQPGDSLVVVNRTGGVVS